jgi:hypothetical protein
MTYRTIHPQFNDTFAYYSSVPEGIREGLWNYFAYGISAGGFCMHVLNNNFLGAVCSADHSWTGRSFQELAKWINQHAPRQAYGSPEKIEAWQRLTDDERRDIMIELRLRPSVIDILRGVGVA